MNRFLIMLIVTGLVTYLTRAIPMIFYRGKEPGKFIKSFLEYIPYAALGGLLFPEVLYSTGNLITALAGGVFASVLILKKQNMIVSVLGTIVLVYFLNLYF
ncbi:AzlD domain-containing protein [Clostridium sp. JNZ J1-5]